MTKDARVPVCPTLFGMAVSIEAQPHQPPSDGTVPLLAASNGRDAAVGSSFHLVASAPIEAKLSIPDGLSQASTPAAMDSVGRTRAEDHHTP